VKASLLVLTVLMIWSLSNNQVFQPAYTIAKIVPEKDQVRPGEIFTVSVDVIPGFGVGISAADVTVSFDVNVLEALSMVEGTLLGDSPLSVMRKINNSEGFVRYAAARQGSTPVPTQPATLITIRFKVRDNAPQTTTQIIFKDLRLTDQNPQPITEVSLLNASIIIQTATTTTTVTGQTTAGTTTVTLITTFTTYATVTFTTGSPYTTTVYLPQTVYIQRDAMQTQPLYYYIAAIAVTATAIALSLGMTGRRRKPRVVSYSY